MLDLFWTEIDRRVKTVAFYTFEKSRNKLIFDAAYFIETSKILTGNEQLGTDTEGLLVGMVESVVAW